MVVAYVIIIVLLVVLSMCFSSADMAYTAVSLTRLEAYKNEKKTKRAGLAYSFAKNYEKTIAILLFGNNLVNIAITSLVTVFAIRLIDENLVSLDYGTLGLIFDISILVIILIFGEIIPKSIVKAKSFRYALFFAYFVRVFQIIFTPFTFIFVKFTSLLAYPFKRSKDIELTDKELEEMVDSLSDEKIIDEDKAEILKGTIDFAKTEAYEIMTPRVDVIAIDIDDDLEDIFKNEEFFEFSRIPVYKESIDNIIGYILTKTLVRMKLEDKPFTLDSILIEPLKFPRSTEINDILLEFKKTKNHLAVIYDEYGGVEGILTMEDILEEIVGEIWDETDDRNEPFVELKSGSFIVDGNMNLEDFLTLIEYDEKIDTDYVTIGGYIIELLDDHFAKVDDEVTLGEWKIKVLAVDDLTVEKILVEKQKIEAD